MTIPVEVADYSFDAEVLKCDIPVLTDFWAEWCGPCQKMAPYLKEIAQEYEGRIKVAKLDIDTNPMTSSHYSVLTMPTLLLFKFGQPVERIVGVVSKDAILARVTPYLDD